MPPTVAPTLREATQSDLAAIERIYHHYVVNSHATFDIEPQSRQPWFSQFDGARYRCIVAKNDVDILGYACSQRFRAKAAYETTVELSVYLDHEARLRGVGKALYRALFEALEGEDLHRAYAGIALPNEASIALHAQFGFSLLGTYTEVGRKFGKYWDVAWYEKPLGKRTYGG